ncbi:hypothetical protein F7D86_06740 [Prevotella copri]|uniref:hypothetical protein n=1 Tax=Segatella copri TaxID=165179 RepID=UPI001292B526|nr:hypothetical protein [Segatella copri]MQN48945.1 hypothetical protein [Segatella copri]
MKKLHTLVLLLACTLAVGCSSGGDDPIDDPKPTPTPTPTPTPSDPTDADLANYKCQFTRSLLRRAWKCP